MKGNPYMPTRMHLRWADSPAWTRCGDLVAWRLHTDSAEDVDCHRCLRLLAQEEARGPVVKRSGPARDSETGRWVSDAAMEQ